MRVKRAPSAYSRTIPKLYIRFKSHTEISIGPKMQLSSSVIYSKKRKKF